MYCTTTDVYRITGLDASDPPVSSSYVTEFILDAMEEVDRIAQTKFLNIETSGTATSSTDSTIVDSSQSWTADEFNTDYMVYITGGTGSGQLRKITDTTTDTLTVTPDWDTNPDTDSTFEVYQNTIISETLNGNGKTYLFLRNFPIFTIQSLSIDSTSVTTSNLYLYKEEGKIELKSGAEYSYFNDTTPQLVRISYSYGVYPMPRHIKELTAILAGMRTLIDQIGGTYNDVTSYTLPELSASKGEPYTNIREALSRLERRKDALLPLIEYYAHFG